MDCPVTSQVHKRSKLMQRLALASALLAAAGCTPGGLRAGPVPLAVHKTGVPNADMPSGLAMTSAELPRPGAAAPDGVPVVSASAPQALQIGHARRLADTQTPALTAARLQWRNEAGGSKVAAIRFNSVGAQGIRLGISVLEIPPGTVFRFSSKEHPDAFAVSGDEIRRLVQSNLDAGDSSEDARTYWSPDLGGSEVLMQVELAPSVNPSALRIYIARLSHIGLDAPVPGSGAQGKKLSQ